MTNERPRQYRAHRFELDADGHVAFSNYKRDGSVLPSCTPRFPRNLAAGHRLGAGARRARHRAGARAEGGGAVPVRRGLYRQASGIRRPAPVTFIYVSGTASFRGASGASEPGIQTWTRCVVLDSRFRPAAGPGMTGVKHAQNRLFRAHLTQSLLFGKTLAPVATGDGVGFLGRHCIFLPADRQSAVLARLAFFADLARRGVAYLDRLLRLAARAARPARSPADDPARAFSETHSAQPFQPSRHRLSVFQRVRFRRDVRLGRAVLPVHLQRHHFRTGDAVRSRLAVDAAGLRDAIGHHRDALSRLRARLLVQSLAQPQGAAAVGIPQSAPQRGSADPAHEFPRASGLHLGLHQHPRVLGRGRQRSRQLHVRRDRLSIRAVGHEHHPGAVHSRLRASPAFAHVDLVPRRARAHLRQPGASSGASLGQSEALQQEFRLLPGAVGLDVRHALCAGEDARAAHVRLSGPAGCAHGEGRVGRSVHQCGGAHLAEAARATCPPCRLRSASRPS